MRVAITGARGRLARVLAPALAAAGMEVVRVSRENGDGCVDYVDFLQGGAGEVDAIVHMAWSCVPATAEASPCSTWREDFPLLERLTESGPLVEGGQFLFFSSGGAIYGDTTGEVVDERYCARPRGIYAAAKAYAEVLVANRCQARGDRACVLRVTNPYGYPPDGAVKQGVIGFAVHAALTGEPFTVWGDGRICKDYLHIDDMTAAVRLALQCRLDGIFNLGKGTSRSLLDVLEVVERCTGGSIDRRHVPAWPWDVGMGTIDTGKLRRATGWEPNISFVDGVERLVGLAREIPAANAGEA